MIIFIHGSDIEKVRRKRDSVIATLKKQRPHAELFSFDHESFSPSKLEEVVGGQGLFEKKFIVILLNVLDEKKTKELILSNLEALEESHNVFVLSEGETSKTVAGKIEKHAHTVYKEGEKKKKKAYSPFGLSDAFGKRNKQKVWLEYQKAKEAGSLPEEINGILFWQIKSILLSKHAKNAKEAGLKPFVFSKSQTFSSHFREEELISLSSQLNSLYHESRRGNGDFDTKLERFLLSF